MIRRSPRSVDQAHGSQSSASSTDAVHFAAGMPILPLLGRKVKEKLATVQNRARAILIEHEHAGTDRRPA
jgi:hypothetical protein